MNAGLVLNESGPRRSGAGAVPRAERLTNKSQNQSHPPPLRFLTNQRRPPQLDTQPIKTPARPRERSVWLLCRTRSIRPPPHQLRTNNNQTTKDYHQDPSLAAHLPQEGTLTISSSSTLNSQLIVTTLKEPRLGTELRIRLTTQFQATASQLTLAHKMEHFHRQTRTNHHGTSHPLRSTNSLSHGLLPVPNLRTSCMTSQAGPATTSPRARP